LGRRRGRAEHFRRGKPRVYATSVSAGRERGGGGWGRGGVPTALVWEGGRGGRPEAVEGRAEDFRSYPKVGLSADFWLARGIDDVTVQKSADSVAQNHHIPYYSYRNSSGSSGFTSYATKVTAKVRTS